MGSMGDWTTGYPQISLQVWDFLVLGAWLWKKKRNNQGLGSIVHA